MKRVLFVLFLFPVVLFSQTQKLFTQFPLKNYIASDTGWIFLQADPLNGKVYKTPLSVLINSVNLFSTLPNGNYDDVSVYSNGVSILINDQKVTNNKLALSPPGTVKGNLSGATAPPTDNNQTALRNFLNYHSVASTGNYFDLINRPTIPANFNPIAGNLMTLSGTYPNITFSVSSDNTKQNVINLTTTGSTGAATLVGSTLNIPQYNLGSGSSQTLDQTLNFGNVTDTGIVFTGTAPLPLLKGNILSSNFLISQFRADTMFGFGMGYSKHVNVNPSFTGSNANNYVWMIGTNVSDGNANRLDTAKGQWLLSFEHNYETVTGSLFNEFHIISTPPGAGGSGVRMLSLNPRHDNKFTDNYLSGGLRVAPMYNASLTGINMVVQNDPANSNKSAGLELYSLNDSSSTYLNLRGYVNNVIRFQRPVGSPGAGTLDDLLKYETVNSKATFINAAPVARYGYGQIVLGGIGNTNLSIAVDIASHPGVLHLGSVAHYADQPYHNPNVVQVNYNNTGFNELNTGIDAGGALRLNNYSAGGHKWTFGANATNFFINNSTGAVRALDILANGEIGIGTTGSVNASAKLEVSSTTKGLLPPRMTTSQVDAISSPSEGLHAYDLTTHEPKYYNGTSWKSFGGSQTLDQTLELGNTTDTTMIFDPNTYATNYEFIRVNPIDTFSSQVPFRMTRWNVPQNSGAVAGNEGLMFGFNLASGGGAIESGKPAIGYSIESNYLPDYSTRYVEWHDLYVPSVTANGLTAGNQVRLSSYTINAATNNIDLYRTVGREYLFIPGTSTQYWIVQPGSFRITDAGGDYVDHSISAHRYTISGSGDTTMSFQGFDYINFGGAALSNLELPQFLPLYYDTLISGVLGTFKVMDLSNRSKYMQFDAQYSNSALQLIGNGLNKLWTTDITEFKMLFASSNNMLLDMEGIRFTGSGQKWLWADDLTMKLGVNTSYRFSEAWVRDGHFNQMAIQSKAGNPTTSDVADGMWMVWKNTTSGDTYIYMNDGGTMKRIASPFVTF